MSSEKSITASPEWYAGQTDGFRLLDVQIASMLERLESSPEFKEILKLTGLALSFRSGEGDACLDVRNMAGRRLTEESGATLPGYDEWNRVLKESHLVGDGSSPTPLVYTADGLLYFYRYWSAENRVAAWVSKRRAAPVVDDISEMLPLFRRLFPQSGGDTPDLQAEAAMSALKRSFLLVAGGPGTGKTTVVARILALLLSRRPELEIALAAPTGKAANRLGTAVSSQTAALPLPDAVKQRIPTEARTIHRLLGYQPDTETFYRNAEHPISADVIIIDEASMIDLTLFDALLDAVPEGAQLIMLGDKDQLSSVEVGYVFADLSMILLGLHAGSGESPTTRSAERQPDVAIELTRNYRFTPESGIGRLAEAVRTGDPDAALDVLGGGSEAEIRLLEDVREVDRVVELLAPELAGYMTTTTPEEALRKLPQGQFLCGTRAGPLGVSAVNAGVNRKLGFRYREAASTLFDHCPVLITTNDYTVELYNGDVGVCCQEGDQITVWFPRGSSEARPIAPARLPPYEIAWAITIHKSQGSEYDHVVLVLPQDASPLLTRELLYTGVTRARRKVEIIGTAETIRKAVAQRTARTSGLTHRIG